MLNHRTMEWEGLSCNRKKPPPGRSLSAVRDGGMRPTPDCRFEALDRTGEVDTKLRGADRCHHSRPDLRGPRLLDLDERREFAAAVAAPIMPVNGPHGSVVHQNAPCRADFVCKFFGLTHSYLTRDYVPTLPSDESCDCALTSTRAISARFGASLSNSAIFAGGVH